ncbi:hypothetical protein AAFF_G00399370 [Aldrovandia affinis]|uniref:Uncharacterized protein n=1 Tax=Aldrovandia affinis TaxID=143900 RepID=A0AAD7WKJ5_9TELE|nr:hypothetical protein AAFF_G00399370 [Aldrovandia affinis]
MISPKGRAPATLSPASWRFLLWQVSAVSCVLRARRTWVMLRHRGHNSTAQYCRCQEDGHFTAYACPCHSERELGRFGAAANGHLLMGPWRPDQHVSAHRGRYPVVTVRRERGENAALLTLPLTSPSVIHYRTLTRDDPSPPPPAAVPGL